MTNGGGQLGGIHIYQKEDPIHLQHFVCDRVDDQPHTLDFTLKQESSKRYSFPSKLTNV